MAASRPSGCIRRCAKQGPVTVPREFVFMDRAAIGLGAVFLHLRAELNFHRLFKRRSKLLERAWLPAGEALKRVGLTAGASASPHAVPASARWLPGGLRQAASAACSPLTRRRFAGCRTINPDGLMLVRRCDRLCGLSARRHAMADTAHVEVRDTTTRCSAHQTYQRSYRRCHIAASLPTAALAHAQSSSALA